MAHRFSILVAGFVLLTFVTLSNVCGMDDDLDVKARASIGNITDEGGQDAPVEVGGSVVLHRKSVAKAMLLSAVLPGLGQAYVGGRRGYASGGVMAAADLFSMWRYFNNTGKGDDKKGEYEAWAEDHYSTQRFTGYVRDTIAVHSGYGDFGFCTDPGIYDSLRCWEEIHVVFPLSDQGSGAFYEQIGAEDRYVFGWDDWSTGDVQFPEELWVDWDPYGTLPAGIPSTSSNRTQYQGMRAEADDFYGKADRYAWVMVIGRVVSMVDAAIMAKFRNRDLAGVGTNPRLTFKARLGSNPNVKVGLKMRF
ncbi:MAG: hypothetical protein ABIJ00_06370 [Candidatus Eisenbacteria bacterium]